MRMSAAGTRTGPLSDADLRRRQLAQIHMGAAKLGWGRDTYEDIMASVCAGVRSAAALSLEQRTRFLAHILACQRLDAGGSAPAQHSGARARLTPPQAKLWALWMQLADRGLVQQRSMRALDAWCARQTGVAKALWCNAAQLDACIEAAKRWLRRGQPDTAQMPGEA